MEQNTDVSRKCLGEANNIPTSNVQPCTINGIVQCWAKRSNFKLLACHGYGQCQDETLQFNIIGNTRDVKWDQLSHLVFLKIRQGEIPCIYFIAPGR